MKIVNGYTESTLTRLSTSKMTVHVNKIPGVKEQPILTAAVTWIGYAASD